jgi:uncharacterized protein (TIGR03067 family)
MNAAMATLVLGLVLGGGDEASKRDLQTLQGTWRPVAIEINGNKLEKGFEDDRLTIKDGRFEMKAGKETMLGTITLDAAKDPRHIDTIITAGANKGLKSIGIYRLTADRLLVCYCVPPNPRPTEFRSDQGSSRALVIYERVKK